MDEDANGNNDQFPSKTLANFLEQKLRPLLEQVNDDPQNADSHCLRFFHSLDEERFCTETFCLFFSIPPSMFSGVGDHRFAFSFARKYP